MLLLRGADRPALPACPGSSTARPRYRRIVQISLLLAHPRPNSFNHALASAILDELDEAGHTVAFHDLYDEGFDPLLRPEECYTTGSTVEELLASSDDVLVATHREEIADADGLVVVHPNWWGKPPAILAGWLDRVLVPGVAYRLTDATGEPDGLLSLRAALVVNTTDTPAQREAEVLGDPLASIWTRCVLPYCGVRTVDRVVVGPVTDSTARARSEWLDEVARRTTDLFGLAEP